MRFIQIINHKKFVLVNIFLFFFVALNLLDGERGLISYFEKQKIQKELIKEKNDLVVKLNVMDKKNSLLMNDINLDYLEIVYREKFMFGKKNERIYIVD